MSSKFIDNKHSHVRICDINGTGLSADGNGKLQVASVMQLGAGGDVSGLNPVPISNANLDSMTFSSGLVVNVGVLPFYGTEGNAWNNATVSPSDVSTTIECLHCHNISVFGTTNSATTLTVQVSQDSNNWYDTSNTIVMVGSGNFHLFFNTGARYIRLRSSSGCTLTASIVAK